MDIPTMRKVELFEGNFSLSDEVEVVIEKKVTPFGNSAKADVPKKYIGQRVYVVVIKDEKE